jgi:P27 family predicted phage terminase small subunit
MPRGRTRKLPQIEILEGRPGKRPVIADYLPAKGEAFIPEHLPDSAQACMEVVKASMPDGIYSQADTYTIAAFASAWMVHREAVHRMADPGFEWIVTSDVGAKKANPWIGIMNEQARMMASLGDRLGLNPKARLGLKLPAERQQRSKYAGLFGPSVSSPSLSC